MRRVAAVIVAFAISLMAFGITGSAAMPQGDRQAAELSHQEAVLKKARSLPEGAIVSINRIDGTSANVIIQAVRPDAIDILIVQQRNRIPATILISEIRSIEELRGSALKSFLKGTGIVVGVLFGTCIALGLASGLG